MFGQGREKGRNEGEVELRATGKSLRGRERCEEVRVVVKGGRGRGREGWTRGMYVGKGGGGGEGMDVER